MLGHRLMAEDQPTPYVPNGGWLGRRRRTRPRRPETEPPLVRAGIRGFLELERRDLLLVLGLVAFSMALRFASPFFPNILSTPLSGPPVVSWGVGHPYNSDECTPPGGGVPVGPPGRDPVTGKPVDHTDVKRCGFVFDEIYFPVDAAKDLRQPAESYFDPEPPLAKLLMAPPIATMGFTTWSWRISTGIFGSLLVGVMYLVALRLRRDRWFATATALFISLDGLAFVEARTGVIDIIAIFFVALFYYLFLLHWQARTRRQWRATLYLMALGAGLAFAAKLTALAPLVVAAALIAMRAATPAILRALPAARRLAGPGNQQACLWRQAAGRSSSVHYALAAVVMAVIFAASFSRYLTIPHNDVYRFTSCNASTTGLVGTADTLTVPHNPVDAVRDIVDIMGAGIQYHEQECHSHPYASRWYTWPVMYHPVLFYYHSPPVASGSTATVLSITDMGNPALWWLAIPALLVCVWRLTRGPPRWRVLVGLLGVVSLVLMIVSFHAAEQPDSVTVRVLPSPLFTLGFIGVVAFCALVAFSAVVSHRFVPAFVVLGYMASWMLWVIGNERRVLFFYHALGMLLFAALGLAYVLAGLRQQVVVVRGRTWLLEPVSWAAVISVVAAFVFFYPVWTAMPLSQPDHQMRLWVDAW